METVALNGTKQTEQDFHRQQELKKSGEIPTHVAVIMDGNGRWAKSRGGVRVNGHQAGVEAVRDTVEVCAQLGVQQLTLYAFSTENWTRPQHEVNALMTLLVQTIRSESKKLHENNIRLTAIGQLDRFPAKCRNQLAEAIKLTKKNTGMELCLALSYSGRWDITQATRKISEKVSKGQIAPEEVSDELISSYLVTADKPDPDLIIRTSGEFRISNFLLWQLAYTEFYITETFWPDFRRDEFYKAIECYQGRERRFGRVSEQIDSNTHEKQIS